MHSEEIYTELGLNYYDLCEYLKEKYGKALYDYFSTPECKSKNPKIGRGNEGLCCHHIDEDKGGNLNGSVTAQRQPFEWQKADRLVYCNLLEHLILHLKICILRQKKKLFIPFDISQFFSTGGFPTISSDIATLFQTQGGTKKYRQKEYENIQENFDDYIFILNLALKYIDDQYVGKKNARTLVKSDEWAIQIDDTPEVIDKKANIFNQLTFSDYIDSIAKECSTTYDRTLFLPIYECLQIDDANPNLHSFSQILLQDFHGFGFPQFNNIFLEKEKFGCSTVDEYISKAFPTYITPSYDINNGKPAFWEGNIPESIIRKDYFYIIRILTRFQIKNNNEPFVYDHSRANINIYRDGMSNDNNFLYMRGSIISRSDDLITLTLIKEDFEKFKETHEIKALKILDGCCFR